MWTLPALAAGWAALLVVLAAGRFSPIERLEAISYDWRARLALGWDTPAATNLGFVDINDESIAALLEGRLGANYRFGLYWPRHLYGRVLRELRAQGARAVAFDVLFGELRPDHAPARVQQGPSPDLRDFLQALHPGEEPVALRDERGDFVLAESDDYFAWQLRQAQMAILAADRGVLPPALFATNAAALGDIAADKDSDGVLRRVRAFRTYRRWHPLFERAAAEYGVDLARARIEPGRIVLRLTDGTELPPVLLDQEGRFALADLVGESAPPGLPPRARPFTELRVWHMGIVLAAQALQLDLSAADADLASGRITLHGADGVQRVIPVDGEGYFYIDWSLPVTDDRLAKQNFITLLEKDRDRELGRTNGIPELWHDRLVVVGSTATGNDLTDLGATPLARETFLLSKHWNVANALLLNRFIRRAPPAGEAALVVGLGLLAVALSWIFRPPSSTLLVAVAAAAYTGLAVLVYVQWRWWLPLVLPVAGGLVLTHGGVLGYQAFFEGREKRRVKEVFSKIVSPSVVRELLQAEKLALGGARREVTVFFADVRGFTELTDASQEQAAEYVRQQGLTADAAEAFYAQWARETLATVNLYLTTVADQVKQHDGTLDKYIGDCVMAFWGAPTAHPHHAAACVRAAIDAQRAVFELNTRRAAENQQIATENKRRAAAGQPPLPLQALLCLGTGINTGFVTVGLMGSDRHLLNYTVFGREVNLASRLEGVSGRGRIVISESTYQHLLRDAPALAAACRPLPPVTVKGIRTPVVIYEVLWQQAGAGGDSPPPKAGAS